MGEDDSRICSLAAPKTGGGLLAAPTQFSILLPTQSGLQLLDELEIPNPEPIPIQSLELFEKLGPYFDSEGCMSCCKWDGRYCADKRDKYCGHTPFKNDMMCS